MSRSVVRFPARLLRNAVVVAALACVSPAAARTPGGPSGDEATAAAHRAAGTVAVRPSVRHRADIVVDRQPLASGVHARVSTPGGVLHAFTPPGYHHQTAGIVVYVHGYHIGAERSFGGQRLAEQFAKSRQNALFIVVDGPQGPDESVKFASLGKILQLVARHGKFPLPHGHVVAVSHSAGYRTLVNWLDYRFLDHVILVDSLYGEVEAFKSWLTKGPHASWHRMVIVGRDTWPQATRFARDLSFAAQRNRIPDTYEELNRREKRARLLVLKSQVGHAELISNRRTLPLLLRLTRLNVVK